MIRFPLPLLAATLLLQACGTAPITGRSQLLLISEEQAIEKSAPAYLQMLGEPAREGKLNNDPALNARVERITARLIAQAVQIRPETRDWEWSMHVVDDPQTVNAWAMAGGKMALYSGLVAQLQPSDDELAQVLGHEIAHALAQHTREQMSRAALMGIGAVILATQTDQQTTAVVTAAATVGLALPHSREAESEADRIGIELAARAGYNPDAAVTLWQKMGEVSGGGGPEFLSTHPAPGNRAKALRKLGAKMRPLYLAASNPPSFAYRSTPIPVN